MTGGLKYYKDAVEEPTHARILISFGNSHHLAFDDQRLFGTIDLIDNPDGYVEEHKLGLDPLDLDFSREILKEALPSSWPGALVTDTVAPEPLDSVFLIARERRRIGGRA